MTQDFANKQRPTQQKKTTRKPRSNTRRKPARKTPKKNSNVPFWAYLVIGLLVAALVLLVLYIVNNPPAEQKSLATKDPNTNTHTKTKPPQPRFDFYEILKQQEIEVPDRSSEIAASTPDNIRYYLQAGSFRNSKDADELRAQLLLLNLEATVEPGTSKGSTWHRVIVGPFTSRSKVAKARSTLASNNLNPLLLKRKVD